MATEAYSVIEQGKVDVLLQASPRDRRLIFEEAAGISRFKAKKIEAQRRLERVEQNLLRLSDIVDEVDNRLRTVRPQAAKAQHYKEYADRLQAAAHAGRVWPTGASLTADSPARSRTARDARPELPAAAAQAERLEAQVLGLELEIVEAEEAHPLERRARSAKIANASPAYEATIEHQRRRRRPGGGSRPLPPPTTAMSLRADNLDDQLREHRAGAGRRRGGTPRAWPAAWATRADADRLSRASWTSYEREQRAVSGRASGSSLRAASALGNQISALEAPSSGRRKRPASAATPAGPSCRRRSMRWPTN